MRAGYQTEFQYSHWLNTPPWFEQVRYRQRPETPHFFALGHVCPFFGGEIQSSITVHAVEEEIRREMDKDASILKARAKLEERGGVPPGIGS